MDNTTKIIIVDDHQLFTDGLSLLLNSTLRFHIAARLKSGRELLHWLSTNSAEIALIDLNMPGIDGIETSEKALKIAPALRIIILSMHADVKLIPRLQKLGIAGYIKKDCDFNTLVSCIERIEQGQSVFDEALLATTIESDSFKDEFFNTFKLSDREKEILSLVRRGFTSKDIADQLFLSSLTVDTHRKNICQKLGIKTAGGLLRFAVEHNL